MRRILFALSLLACSRPESRPGTAKVRTDAVRDTALRSELLRRMKVDQDARFALIAKQQQGMRIDSLDVARITDIDTANTAWLRTVVASRGWPGSSMVGGQAAQAAFLIVQHADRDTAFQAAMLPLLERAYLAGDAAGQDFALLTDRVASARGQPQVYGSQAQVRDGRVIPNPIADSANVDARRARVGLPPLAEYLRELKEMYLPRAESPSLPSARTREFSESAVYSAILNSVFRGSLPDTIVLRDRTIVFTPPSGRMVESWKREYDTIPPELISSLVVASQQSRRSESLSIVDRPVLFFPDTNRAMPATQNPDRFWSAFHERYSNAPAILSLSPIGFSPDGKQAIVYYDYSCGGRCGHSDLIWLELGVDGRWLVRKILNFRMV